MLEDCMLHGDGKNIRDDLRKPCCCTCTILIIASYGVDRWSVSPVSESTCFRTCSSCPCPACGSSCGYKKQRSLGVYTCPPLPTLLDLRPTQDAIPRPQSLNKEMPKAWLAQIPHEAHSSKDPSQAEVCGYLQAPSIQW